MHARNAILVLALLSVERVDAQPAEVTFLNRFSGSWAGTGTVQRNAATSPWHVNCLINGSPGANRISIQGSCHGAIIVERRIGAELTYDSKSGAYQGVYTGARVGQHHDAAGGRAARQGRAALRAGDGRCLYVGGRAPH